MKSTTPASKKPLSSQEIANTLRIKSGHLNPSALSVYSMIRDELFCLPSFLNHYRTIGAKQFIILDDGSKDGSTEYLQSQDDCVVLEADFKYGDTLNGLNPNGKQKSQRAGIWYKQMIPRKYLDDQYVLYADADEFLLLPDPYQCLEELYLKLSAREINAVSASLLELYPKNLQELEKVSAPMSLDEMIGLYPFYDHRQLVKFGTLKRLKQVNPSPTHRLLEQHHIKSTSWIRRLAGRRSAYVLHKTPIFKNSPQNWLIGSHHSLLRSSRRILLCLLHMKWTHDLHRKTRMALELGSYAKNSERYQNYAKLFSLAAASEEGLNMTIKESRQLLSTNQLIDAGLMVNAL